MKHINPAHLQFLCEMDTKYTPIMMQTYKQKTYWNLCSILAKKSFISR